MAPGHITIFKYAWDHFMKKHRAVLSIRCDIFQF